MKKENQIPVEWDLAAGRRYIRQNMEKAMKGKIERGLVELITNSDDWYRDLEDKEKQVSGKIRIEVERKRGGRSIVKVRDRATGMSRSEMYSSLGRLGERTSGFEKGKKRRGLHGRGAKDVAAFGKVHFESIKNEEYNCLIIPPSLRCRFTNPGPARATEEIRNKLGIPRGNGTVVTIEVESRFKLPQHDTFVKDFCRYYSLRDIFSNPHRDVTIVDMNRRHEDRLIYKYPEGEVVFDDDIPVPDYPEAKAHLRIIKHPTPFDQYVLSFYQEGILVKSGAAIHDCTHFGLHIEPFSWRFTGSLQCEYIDDLIREYDDIEEANPDQPHFSSGNPMRLLDPFRDGLVTEHLFAKALYGKCKEILKRFVDELKAAETPPLRSVSDESLNRELEDLSKEISKIFEEKSKDLEEELPPGSELKGPIEELPVGLHIIPPDEIPIVVNQPKTFSIVVKHYEVLDKSTQITISSSHPDVKLRETILVLKRLLHGGKIGRTTFTVEGAKVGTKAFIEARSNGYSNVVLVKVVEAVPPPELPDGLSFEKPHYRLALNKEKSLTLWLKGVSKPADQIVANVISSHPQIVVMGGGTCKLRETDGQGLYTGKVRIVGRRMKAKGTITAKLDVLSAQTRIEVEEREVVSGVKFSFDPVDKSFGPVRYEWGDDKEPYHLRIGAQHGSISRYLGTHTEQGWTGQKSPQYRTVLAEVIAEALAFNMLEKRFRREGERGLLDYDTTNTYYHRDFSDFLSIAHKYLGRQPEV